MSRYYFVLDCNVLLIYVFILGYVCKLFVKICGMLGLVIMGISSYR